MLLRTTYSFPDVYCVCGGLYFQYTVLRTSACLTEHCYWQVLVGQSLWALLIFLVSEERFLNYQGVKVVKESLQGGGWYQDGGDTLQAS